MVQNNKIAGGVPPQGGQGVARRKRCKQMFQSKTPKSYELTAMSFPLSTTPLTPFGFRRFIEGNTL